MASVHHIEERRRALGLVRGPDGRLAWAKPQPAPQADLGDALRALADGGAGIGAILRALADALDAPKPSPAPIAPANVIPEVIELEPVPVEAEKPQATSGWITLPSGHRAQKRTTRGGTPFVRVEATDSAGNLRDIDVFKQGDRLRMQVRDRALNLHVAFVGRDGQRTGHTVVAPGREPREWQ